MTYIDLMLEGEELLATSSPTISSGDVNSCFLRLTPSLEWDGFALFGYFTREDMEQRMIVPFNGTTCPVPSSLLSKAGQLICGVVGYGIADRTIIKTSTLLYYKIKPGACWTVDIEAVPAQSVWDGFIRSYAALRMETDLLKRRLNELDAVSNLVVTNHPTIKHEQSVTLPGVSSDGVVYFNGSCVCPTDGLINAFIVSVLLLVDGRYAYYPKQFYYNMNEKKVYYYFEITGAVSGSVKIVVNIQHEQISPLPGLDDLKVGLYKRYETPGEMIRDALQTIDRQVKLLSDSTFSYEDHVRDWMEVDNGGFIEGDGATETTVIRQTGTLACYPGDELTWNFGCTSPFSNCVIIEETLQDGSVVNRNTGAEGFHILQGVKFKIICEAASFGSAVDEFYSNWTIKRYNIASKLNALERRVAALESV